MIEVFKKGDERFAVVDNIRGMGRFQKRTSDRMLRPMESREGSVYRKGTLRVWVAKPMAGKSAASQQDTEKWAQDEELSEKFAILGLPPATNKHLKMEWCLHEARRRAGVLGMDYETQSQNYIMEAASYLMLHTIFWAESNLRPPWKMNIEAALIPYPLRNYMWTAIEYIVNREAKKLLYESVVVEVIGLTPDKPLYEQALRERQAQGEAIIRLGQPMAPPETASWIDINSEEVIDELIRTGQLPGVPKNYRDSFEKESFAVRRVLRWYSEQLLDKYYARTRSLIGINKLLPGYVYNDNPEAFEEKYSPPIPEIAFELFGETGLGLFKPEMDSEDILIKDRVKVEPPGLPWLTLKRMSPFQDPVLGSLYSYTRGGSKHRYPRYDPHNPPIPDKPQPRQRHA